MGGSRTSFIRDWWHSPPAYLGIRSSKWTIGITAFGACFTDGFLYGSIVPVLPFSLVDRSGVSEDDVQFWLSLLLMVFGLFLGGGAPIAGWAADRGSRSTPFLFGLVLAFGATMLFCFGRRPWLLLLGRVFQGLSASVIYTAGLALVADAVGADEIGAWMGFVFSGNTLGLLFSPFLAGIIYDYLGYYAVFIVLFGVIAFDIAIRGFMIEKRTADKWLEKESSANNNAADEATRQTDDVRSDQGSTVVENENTTPQAPPPDETSSLLHSRSKRSKSWIARTFPTTAVLVTSPRLLFAIYGCFTHTMLLACIDSILPLFVKRTFEWTSTGAGVIFLTITCPSVGLNLILPPLLADLFYEVDILTEIHSDTFGKGGAYAQAYSLMCAALGAGTAFGPIWAGVFYQETNWPITMATLAVLTSLPAVGVYRYTGGSVKEEKPGRPEPGGRA
ncbi:MAG: hypothetical protein Q9188_006619 [Gyalolechia gomerana]